MKSTVFKMKIRISVISLNHLSIWLSKSCLLSRCDLVFIFVHGSLSDFYFKFREQQQEVVGAADHDDGIIPGSPIVSLSTSVLSRMRRRKENRHIGYTAHASSEHSRTQIDGMSMIQERLT